MNTLEALLPRSAERVFVCLMPINARWGPDKLRALCRESGVEPDPSTAFLFINKRRDILVLYIVDEDGDRTLMKQLDRGAFLLPLLDTDKPAWATVPLALLPRLFRS